MFSSSRNFLFCFCSLIYVNTNVKIMSIFCSVYVHIMSVYYVQLLYVHIMLNKCQEHVKIIFVKDQKQNNKKLLKMKTPRFFID